MSSASTFLQKLLTMIEHPDSDQYISWCPNGTSFIVYDSIALAKDVLPQYFRHNKFTSFVRQLNMYDFHKIPLSDTGIEPNENAVQFKNPNFLRGQPHLFANMRRKASSRNEKVNSVVGDKEYIDNALANLAQAESNMSKRLNDVESDSTYIKDELSKLYQSNYQQEHTVNRIMEFLTSVYGPNSENNIPTLNTNQNVHQIQYGRSPNDSPLIFSNVDKTSGNFQSSTSSRRSWVQ